MEIQCDYSKPEDVTRAFITQMARWEYETTQAAHAAEKTDNASSFWPHIKEKMDKVFAEYCTPKERPFGRQGSFTERANSDVEILVLEVVEESSRRCSVTVEQVTHYTYKGKEQFMSEKFQYTLLKQCGRWLVDNRKLHAGGKWIKYTL